jgi:uncharacterized C2H2 Zn-finger protein
MGKYTCDRCGIYTTDDRSNFRKHRNKTKKCGLSRNQQNHKEADMLADVLAEASPDLAEPNHTVATNNFKCSFCNKIFRHRSSLSRHVKSRCKVKKERDNQCLASQQQFVAHTTNNNNNSNNTTINTTNNNNTQTNNITINVVGCEDVKHLMDHPAITKTFKLLYNGNDKKAVVAMGQAVYNDEAHPENKTIMFKDDRQGSKKVSQGNGHWTDMMNEEVRDIIATRISTCFLESGYKLQLNKSDFHKAIKCFMKNAATPMDNKLSVEIRANEKLTELHRSHKFCDGKDLYETDTDRAIRKYVFTNIKYTGEEGDTVNREELFIDFKFKCKFLIEDIKLTLSCGNEVTDEDVSAFFHESKIPAKVFGQLQYNKEGQLCWKGWSIKRLTPLDNIIQGYIEDNVEKKTGSFLSLDEAFSDFENLSSFDIEELGYSGLELRNLFEDSIPLKNMGTLNQKDGISGWTGFRLING